MRKNVIWILPTSRQLLKQRYDAIEHSKDWYCLDFWAKTLDLPLRELYQAQGPTLKVRSDVAPFLQAVRKMNKQMILLTDSNPFSLALKLQYCDFVATFDLLLSSHHFGARKLSNHCGTIYNKSIILTPHGHYLLMILKTYWIARNNLVLLIQLAWKIQTAVCQTNGSNDIFQSTITAL